MTSNLKDKEELLKQQLDDIKKRYEKELQEIEEKQEQLELVKSAIEKREKYKWLYERRERRIGKNFLNPRRKKNRQAGFKFAQDS